MSYDLETAEKAAYAPFFGYMGAASAQIFTVLGAAYGTAKSAVGMFVHSTFLTVDSRNLLNGSNET